MSIGSFSIGSRSIGLTGNVVGSLSLSFESILNTAVFGNADITPGPAQLNLSSINAENEFGQLTLANAQLIVRATGIPTTQIFGSTSLIGGVDAAGWLTGRLNIKPALTALVGVNRVH